MQLETSCYLAFVALASVLERPFVTCAGVGGNALGASVLANIVASPAWLVFAGMAELSMRPYKYRVDGSWLGVFLFVFAFQVMAKTLIVRVSARKPVNVWYVVGGTSFSLGLTGMLFIYLVSVSDRNPGLWVKMTSYVPQCSLASYTVFIAILLTIAFQTISAFLTNIRSADGTGSKLRASGQQDETDG